MTLSQANREKTKVKLSAADPGPDEMLESCLSSCSLIARSMILQTKVRRLDTTSTRGDRARRDRQSGWYRSFNRLKAHSRR